METRSKTAVTAGREPAWLALVPASQLEILRLASGKLEHAGVESLLGGAFAIAHHIGRWRDTKDIDFLIRPEDRDRAVAALTAAGFADYFDQIGYDRSWIYRSHRDDVLVDLIWTLPNHVAVVDDDWFAHAGRQTIAGAEHRVVPLEELIWIKLFVLQRDRCDWPDVINLVRCNTPGLDWNRLLSRVGESEPLLRSALGILEWIAPECARELPERIRTRFRIGERPDGEVATRPESQRAALLDSRPWYAAVLPPDAVMSP